MPAAQQILTIILSRELFEKLEPFFGRDALEINTATNGKGSLVLVRNLPFDLIVVEHPLPDMELVELLQEIRGPRSRCRDASVLVLTRQDPEALTAAARDDLVTIHALAAGADDLLMLTAKRLGVAARRATRLLVQIEVELGAAQILRVLQSVNLSETGLLLQTDRPLPLETQVTVKFSLPYSNRMIQATGRVVRYTDRDAGGLVGLAIHFDVIHDEDREAIAGFIADHSAQSQTEATGA